MQECKLTIINETGLHARPANQFVQTAKSFECDITIKKGDNTVDAKSILGILTLGAGKGAQVEIKADGKDEKQAIKALSELINKGLE